MKKSNKEPQIIYETITSNEIYAKTEIFQTFCNDYKFPLEIIIEIPLLNNYNLTKFNIKLEKKNIQMKYLQEILPF